MNILTIKGRITANPETHTSNTGTTYCNFTVAVNRKFQKDTADFINCTAFGKSGEFIGKYFVKGQEILCSGELHIDKYVKDDETRTAAKLIVDNAEFCGSKNGNGSSNANAPSGFVEVADDDGLPF